jgi:aminoglycoside phosphotransferase (APT) family kinase protein
MIDGNNLIGVLDWEFAGWSDPMEDVAWFCAKCWRFGFNNKEAGGMGSRAAFYDAYENASSRTIDHEAINFWEIMAHIRWAIIARQQGERFATSGEKSLEPAMTAFIAPQLEWEVMRMTEDWGR